MASMLPRLLCAASVSVFSLHSWHSHTLHSTTKCDDDANSLMNSIGNTPLILLSSLSKETGCLIYGKAEWMNPTGSVKDRAAKMIIKEAEQNGLITPGKTILIEGTGGNTGIALAQIARSKGYSFITVMPNCIGPEKILLQERLGAKIHLQPLVPYTNPLNYARYAETLGKELENGFHTNQFENTANFRAHYSETGPEIYRQTQGKVDAFVCSAGTGGTIAGITAFLKEVKPSVKTFLIDPDGSCLYEYLTNNVLKSSGSSFIEGIGIGRITKNFSQAKIDHALRGSDREAVEMAYYLMREEGIYIGSSAALNVVGAVKVAKKLGPGHVVVTILCDSGERYVSKLYNKEWLEQQNLLPTTPTENTKSLSFIQVDK